MIGGDSTDHAPSSAASGDAVPASRDGAVRVPNLDGLLCALVLAPGMYARNRFFRLFEDPAARRVRRRATHVRSVLRSLRERGSAEDVLPTTNVEESSGDIEVSFRVPSLGLTRRTQLAPLELTLVRYALKVGSDAARARDKAVVEGALAELAPRT